MSGEDRRVSAALLRTALAAAEPAYVTGARVRNWLFDAGLRKAHRLPRPTISIGNLTTGGTGKTPMVRWLAGRLREGGRRVAVLSRGYKASAPGSAGDEQIMLDRSLNSPLEERRIAVVANPDRIAGAEEALRQRPDTDVFLLDDGFQHRRAARDLDIVLISAANPFGYGHALPRGMLREPVAGVARAGAVVITHAGLADDEELSVIEQTIRRHNPAAPVFRAFHAPTALRSGGTSGPASAEHSPQALRDRGWFAFCGVGDPHTFLRQLQALGGRCAGHRFFADHHQYTPHDRSALVHAAAAAGADVLVTTEKDWVKWSALPDETGAVLPVWRLDVEIGFLGDDERRLLEEVESVLPRRTA